MNKKIAYIMLISAGLALLGLYRQSALDDLSITMAQTAAAHRPAPGIAAPAFRLEGLDGRTYVVGGPRERPLIVNFWASWCGPCQEEAPDLVRLYERYKDKLDLYAVNVTQGDSLPAVQSFVKRNGLPFPVLLDKRGRAAERYRILAVPTSFLIGKDGLIKEIVHVVSPEEWVKKVNRLIGEEGGGGTAQSLSE